MDYYNNSRSDMLEFIPHGCCKILEIGCGEGLFGELVMKHRSAEVWGVEPVKEAADKAVQRLTKTINATYDEKIVLPENYFDCIVFNDVLEHIVNPSSILQISKRFLNKRNSFIVASIPNFRYWDNVVEILIHKSLEYKDSGILDKTHVRFFTKRSIATLFQELDYEILTLKGITATPSKKFAIANILLLNTIEDMQYLQFGVVAKLK
jgi:2-polyprenyl-3-methyl-5-hydroxy-6-metoxy-1,4-benzoquinol methylase